MSGGKRTGQALEILEKQAQVFITPGKAKGGLSKRGLKKQTCTELWSPFCVAFAPLFLKGNLPCYSTGNHPVSLGPLLFLQNLQHGSTVFLHQRRGGQNMTRNGGPPPPQIGAGLTLFGYLRKLGSLKVEQENFDLSTKQKIEVKKCWVQECEIGEEC